MCASRSPSAGEPLARLAAVVTVEVYDPEGAPLDFAQLRSVLSAALDLADSHSSLEDQQAEAGISAKDGSSRGTHLNASLLTALNRDEWAAQRATLLGDPISAEVPRHSDPPISSCGR